MRELESILASLADSRPVFHSEADFQHALAWAIHERDKSCELRLELRSPDLPGRAYIDIWLTNGDTATAVELKYKTRKLAVQVGKESFSLLDQSAQDIARYDFLKDIQRLEELVGARGRAKGYAVFLTNDSAYWVRARGDNTVDAAFRIHEGRTVTGTFQWGAGASKGTMRDRERPLEVKGRHELHWRDYSEPSATGYGLFRYLVVAVNE
jgi:hypothetical protein